jgi:hypothetical protein
MRLRKEPSGQVGDGPGLKPMGQGDVFQYRVFGWPTSANILIGLEAGRWRVHRSDGNGWQGDYTSADAALEALEGELSTSRK